MSDKQENLPVKREDFSLAQQGSLLDAALSQLPKEQQERLLAKAIEKRLDIDEEAKKADLRYKASSLDMVNTIHQVKALEQTTKSDYTVRAEYQTASGKTNIEIKSGCFAMLCVIALPILIPILLILRP
jgi:hypothetical protein